MACYDFGACEIIQKLKRLLQLHCPSKCFIATPLLLRCHILWWLPAKMTHLLAGGAVLYISILFISILNGILTTIENASSYVLLIGAIYCYYESCRRMYNDSQLERLHAVNLMQKKGRKVALRKQVCFVCNSL